jgi:hypothetical protein
MTYASGFTALYDANVLYSAPLRDLLMRLSMTGLYRAKWTEEINDMHRCQRATCRIKKPAL